MDDDVARSLDRLTDTIQSRFGAEDAKRRSADDARLAYLGAWAEASLAQGYGLTTPMERTVMNELLGCALDKPLRFYRKTIRWTKFDGSTMEVSEGDYCSAADAWDVAIRSAKRAGWTVPKWWQWWRRHEEMRHEDFGLEIKRIARERAAKMEKSDD